MVGKLLRVVVSLNYRRVLLLVVRLVVHHVLRGLVVRLVCVALLVLLEADVAKICRCLNIRHRVVILHCEVRFAPESLRSQLLRLERWLVQPLVCKLDAEHRLLVLVHDVLLRLLLGPAFVTATHAAS